MAREECMAGACMSERACVARGYVHGWGVCMAGGHERWGVHDLGCAWLGPMHGWGLA